MDWYTFVVMFVFFYGLLSLVEKLTAKFMFGSFGGLTNIGAFVWCDVIANNYKR